MSRRAALEDGEEDRRGKGRKEEQEKVHLESANGARRKLAAPEPKQDVGLFIACPLRENLQI